MKKTIKTPIKPRVIVGFNTSTLVFKDRRRVSRQRAKEELRQTY